MKFDKRLMKAYRQNPKRVREIFETARNQSLTSRYEIKNEILRPYDKNRAIIISLSILLPSIAYGISTINSPQHEQVPALLALLSTITISFKYMSTYDRTNIEGYEIARQSALENLITKSAT